MFGIIVVVAYSGSGVRDDVSFSVQQETIGVLVAPADTLTGDENGEQGIVGPILSHTHQPRAVEVHRRRVGAGRFNPQGIIVEDEVLQHPIVGVVAEHALPSFAEVVLHPGIVVEVGGEGYGVVPGLPHPGLGEPDAGLFVSLRPCPAAPAIHLGVVVVVRVLHILIERRPVFVVGHA